MMTSDTLYTDTIVAMTCGTKECGVVFGLSQSYIKARREDHATWWCPNGHPRHWPQKNELEQTKAQLRQAKEEIAAESRRLGWARADLRQAREQVEYERRSAAATRGHMTRLRNKIAHGICPCCRRNFENVARHMQGQHAAWLEEKGIEL